LSRRLLQRLVASVHAARQFPVPGKPSCSPAKRGFSPCFLLFLCSFTFPVRFYSGLITPVNTSVITLLSGEKIVLVHLNASIHAGAWAFDVEQAGACLCGRMKSALYLVLHPRGFGSETESFVGSERHSLLNDVFRCSLLIFCSFSLLLRFNTSRDILGRQYPT
jgi:hypothetical protein